MAKLSKKKELVGQVEMPFVALSFFVPVIKLPQPDGSLLIKAGKPQIVESEVTVSQFHRQTGVSMRHIQTLCEQGMIQHRRLTPKRVSKILIPRSEIERFKNLHGDE
jgi:hypothetical protein